MIGPNHNSVNTAGAYHRCTSINTRGGNTRVPSNPKKGKRNINLMMKFYYICIVLFVSLLSVVVGSRHQSCDSLECCPGTVCTERGTPGRRRSRCKEAKSCELIQCPSGFRCTDKNPRTPKSKVHCRVSCENVTCPGFLECREKGRGRKSYAECKLPKQCNAESCVEGAQCVGFRRRYSLCLANNCSSIDCGEGAECREGRIKGNKRFRTKSVHRFLKYLYKPPRTNTKTHFLEAAICVPLCTNDTCPQGLVCEQRKLKLVCRPPRSCEELNCPVGQTCRVTKCKRNVATLFEPTKKRSKSRSKLNFECVDITANATTSITPSATTSIAGATSITSSETMTTSATISPTPASSGSTVLTMTSSSSSLAVTTSSSSVSQSSSSPSPSQTEDPLN